MSLPSTIRAWQYNTTVGGLENNLKLNTVPFPTASPDEHIVKILATALNPVDFKPAESTLFRKLLIKTPATPGIDIAARIVQPAAGSDLKPGQLVCGAADSKPFAAGGLSEYKAVPKDIIVAVPEGLTPIQAACVPVAGLTAYQTIIPYVKPGDRIFLNGGSGGVGLFGIQMAKAVGCHVTVTCSTRNVELCKQYGADEVIDYTKGNLIDQLKKQPKFNHFVENAGTPRELYFKCHEFTTPDAVYINVAGSPDLKDILFTLKAKLLPAFLGGGRRPMLGFFAAPKLDDVSQITKWVAEGKVKTVVDSTYSFEQAPEAFRKLKTGRARGKIVVEVTKEDEKS